MKIFLALCVVLTGATLAMADVRKPNEMSMTAGTAVHGAVSVVLASTSTTAAVSKGIQRIITNNSAYTIYKTNAQYSVAVTTSTGTPIFSHEHYIETQWFDAMWFAADPAATSNACDIRVESQVWQ